jgi:hypothetical protein
MFKTKKTNIDPDAVQAQTANQAMDFIFAGLKWYLINKTIKTVIFIVLLCGGLTYTIVNVYTDIVKAKARIEHQTK